MTKLTKREKILINVVLVLVLVYGGLQFVINPQTAANEALSIEYDNLLAQKEAIEMQLNNSALNQTDITTLEKELFDKLQEVEEIKDHDLIDDLFQSVTDELKIDVKELLIEQDAISNINPVTAETTEITTYPLKEYINSIYNNGVLKEEVLPYPETLLIKSTVRIAFTYDKEKVAAFVGAIDNLNTTIYINGIEYDSKDVQNKYIYIDLISYLREKVDVKQ